MGNLLKSVSISLCVLFASIATTLQAQVTYNWTGGTSGSWTTAGNWTGPLGVPRITPLGKSISIYPNPVSGSSYGELTQPVRIPYDAFISPDEADSQPVKNH